MFKWLKNPDPEDSLNELNRQFVGMLADGRHIFDAASNCLLGGTDHEVIREDLFKTDQRINLTEQQIRREIVVHGSVYGSGSFPGLLVLMSLVKDAERIGDYGKNVFDLALSRKGIHDQEEHAKLVAMKDVISKLMIRAIALCETQDVDGARKLTWEADGIADQCDSAIDNLVGLEGVNPSIAILCFRYYKRIVGHISNVVSSIFMPIDKLDFFDEDQPR